MELGTIISVIALMVSVVVGGPLMWQIRTNNRDLRDLQREHAKFTAHVAEHYVPKDLLENMLKRERDGIHREFNEVKDMIKRIFSKLDKSV